MSSGSATTPPLLHLLAEASPDPTFALNAEGGILAWNSAAGKVLSLSDQDLGSSWLEKPALESSREVLAEGFSEARILGTSTRQLTVRSTDGPPVEASIVLKRLQAGTGSEVLVAAYLRTETRPPVSVTAERFHGLLEAAPDAMVMVEKSGRIVLVNGQTEKVFGYKRGELIGLPVEVLVPQRFHGRHPGHRHGYAKDPHTRPMGAGLDLFARRKDGTEFPAEISLAPLETEEGMLVTAAIRDITERKRLEEEVFARRSQELESQNRRMQEANRLKSEFLANMSHELRTPLNAIIGFAELIHDGHVEPGSAQHQEFLGDILNGGKHLLQLINDVLDLSKIEAGKVDFVPEPMNVGLIVGEVIATLRPTSTTKRLRLESDVDATLTNVFLDPNRFRQVLYNYLSNALKFTPEGGRVAVRVASISATEFRLDVEDTGIGIRREDMQKLFVEFQQVDSGFGKRHGGTGLGLALTKRLVEAQGGTVEVRSEFGVGSVFSAVLPRRMRSAPGGKAT